MLSRKTDILIKLNTITSAVINNKTHHTVVAEHVKHFGAQTVAVSVWVATASAVAKMKRKGNRQQLIYQLALGGISSAIALLLVWLSVVVRYGTIGFFVAACVALLVPLSQRYYFATISAYVVSSLLAFAIVGDIFMISGYVVCLAPLSIMSAIMLEKKVKWYISMPIKAVFSGLALAFLYYVAGTIMISPDIIGEVPFWAVELVGIVALILVDLLMNEVYKVLKVRVERVLRKRVKEIEEEEDADVNPFDNEE